MKSPHAGHAGWPENRQQDTTHAAHPDQATLFDATPQKPTDATSHAEPTLEEKFKKFDADNPQVFEAFQQIATQLLARGRRQHGARAILERVRWDLSLTTTGDDFKLNNNFVALYARKLIAEDSRFSKFFALRTQGVQRARP
jgi:hypothetical protein